MQDVGNLRRWFRRFCLTKRSVHPCHLFFKRQPTNLSLGDTEALFKKIRLLSQFVRQCFNRSSRKDELIEVVRESMATGIWHRCLQDLDNWSDWERFAALALLVAAVGPPYHDVLDCSFLLLKFTQLRFCFHRTKYPS